MGLTVNSIFNKMSRSTPIAAEEFEQVQSLVTDLYIEHDLPPVQTILVPSPKAAGQLFHKHNLFRYTGEANDKIRRNTRQAANKTGRLSISPRAAEMRHQRIAQNEIFRRYAKLDRDALKGNELLLTFPSDLHWVDAAIENKEVQSNKKLYAHLSLLHRILMQVHCIMFLDKLCIVVDFPIRCSVNGSGRLHNDKAPALEYTDGTARAYWSGTDIPLTWVTGQPPTPREALAVANLEKRLAACAIVGWDKILKSIDATLIDKDVDPSIGTLYHARIAEHRRPIGLLKVRCGTGREFVLQTPALSSALEANAWTYGLRPEEYKPELRT